VLVAALVVVLGLAIYVAVRHNFAFAHPVTSFGAKGIGAGLFEDPRFLGVDGSGNIVVADYTDGRVQVFAPGGKYLSMFTVMNAAGKPANAFHIAVGQDGRIYVANGDIQVYAADGRLSGKISAAGNHAYNGALTVGPDGRLYALTDNGSGDLVRFNADGSIDLDVPNAVAVVSSAGYLRAELAVDGLGNIYIAAETVILKYSPEGKFLDQFGGKADDPKFFQPGKFHDIWGIAIDGYGRIFVSDDFDLQVLDANGAYLNKISDSYAGLAFDAQNHLYASMVVGTRKVFEFQIQKPLQQ
jgi:outer membrane protein assembly factor BamB